MTEHQRLHKLLQIAEQDPYYKALQSACARSMPRFYRFVDSQSAHTRTVLNTYIYTYRMMLQHLTRLACTHMMFSDE